MVCFELWTEEWQLILLLPNLHLLLVQHAWILSQSLSAYDVYRVIVCMYDMSSGFVGLLVFICAHCILTDSAYHMACLGICLPTGKSWAGSFKSCAWQSNKDGRYLHISSIQWISWATRWTSMWLLHENWEL